MSEFTNEKILARHKACEQDCNRAFVTSLASNANGLAAHVDRRILLRRMEETKTVLLANNKDLHNWSTRPCATCAAVTAVTGVLFGCDAYRKRDEDSKERLRKRREEG